MEFLKVGIIGIFAVAISVGASASTSVFASVYAHSPLQCPAIAPKLGLEGGDKTDPRHLNAKAMKLIVGRWSASANGLRIIDINLVKGNGNTSKVNVTLHEYDDSTKTWHSAATEDVDYVNGMAVFHLPRTSENERTDIILAAFKKDGKTQVVASVTRCDSNGAELLRGGLSSQPFILKRILLGKLE